MSIRLASLFSGCGGFDLAFAQQGFRIVFAIDNDRHACETYRRNLGDHIVCADIADYDLDSIPECDLIIGGFPCQDFSKIGHTNLFLGKGIESERGNLYLNFVKAVARRQPVMFCAENVLGLLSANGGRAIQRIIDDFSSVGYMVYHTAVNFADYGVAQQRKRVLIFGVRKDCKGMMMLPLPTHLKSEWITASQAFEGVEDVEANNEISEHKEITIERLRRIPPGGNWKNIPQGRYAPPGRAYLANYLRRLHPDRPAFTILANSGSGYLEYHYEHLRSLTNRERARLFGYADDFFFCGAMGSVRRQIGNSVPPGGMPAFAEAIRLFIEEKK